jgi:hypothetical protein
MDIVTRNNRQVAEPAHIDPSPSVQPSVLIAGYELRGTPNDYTTDQGVRTKPYPTIV